MATNAELIALFGDDFESVLAGLSQLPPEARQLLDQAMGKMLYDADVFTSRVNKAVQTQAAAGISTNAIKAGLLTDMQTGGPVFGEIRNSVKGALVEGINQSSRAGQFQALDPESDTLFTWVTIAGHKVCLDCAPRGGQQKTLKEWEQEGLPGTGWSVCKGYCYCIIDPSGKISPRLQMEGVVEKGATVRKKAVSATAVSATSTALDKKFTSGNAEGNQHFVDAFTDSSKKFKQVLGQFPELRHISQRGSGYFTEHRNRAFEKWYKGEKDIKYQTRHGGINIEYQIKNTPAYKREYGTIRHEYGHFMHHNIHPNIGKMDSVYKKYYADLKNGVVVSVDDFAKLNKLSKADADQLKFQEAYFKSRHKLGVGSKYKLTNKVMSESRNENWGMMHEMRNMVHFDLPGGKYFTKDHALIKALKKDENATMAYIQDLFGALTHNKIGYGHADSYYKWATMDRHEVFANLTALYSHQDPIYWNWLKQTLPELTTYYEELMETILRDGYFGTAMN